MLVLSFIATLLHGAMMFAAAPLVVGGLGKFRARLLRRRGPPVLQPYFVLQGLLQRAPVMPDTATELYVIWPYVSFAAAAAAALVVPGFCAGMLTAPMSDFIVVIGLLTLARAGPLMAGFETGFGFGGAGAARDVLFGVFSEAALLVVILSFVLMTGKFGIDGIAQGMQLEGIGISIPQLFAFAAIIPVALTQTGRVLADGTGQPELAMVREAMLLEYSGRYLLLFEYASMLRLITWMSLIGALFFPFGLGRAGAVLSWPEGVLLWGGRLFVMSVVLALFEVSAARVRVFRVPELLGAATLFGILSAVFIFVAARFGA